MLAPYRLRGAAKLHAHTACTARADPSPMPRAIPEPPMGKPFGKGTIENYAAW